MREQAKEEEANRIAREEEEKRQKHAREKEETEKRNKLLTNKERFFRGEELFWMDERDVLKSLTTEEIKAHGLSIPFFEKLYKYYDPELSYHKLEGVHNGFEAMNIFPQIQYMEPQEQETAHRNLLKSCELDTYAMVKLWQELIRVGIVSRI